MENPGLPPRAAASESVFAQDPWVLQINKPLEPLLQPTVVSHLFQISMVVLSI